MARWEYKVRLKDLLDEDTSDEAARTAAGAIATRLKKVESWKSDTAMTCELEGIIDEFEEISDPNVSAVELAGRFGLCKYFNNVMNALYDWADYHRVWID
jgi:hypothetical protein